MNPTSREDLYDALRRLDDTMGTLARKLDHVAWAALRPIERSLYLHGLRKEVRRTGGRLVQWCGMPHVWTAFDDMVHGGCKCPAWA
jgi:hypothetical protein